MLLVAAIALLLGPLLIAPPDYERPTLRAVDAFTAAAARDAVVVEQRL
jgi:hypothetical protein